MIEVQLEGCICELNFGYNAKMEGYTNISSDIPELYERLANKRRKGVWRSNQNQYSKTYCLQQ